MENQNSNLSDKLKKGTHICLTKIKNKFSLNPFKIFKRHLPVDQHMNGTLAENIVEGKPVKIEMGKPGRYSKITAPIIKMKFNDRKILIETKTAIYEL